MPTAPGPIDLTGRKPVDRYMDATDPLRVPQQPIDAFIDKGEKFYADQKAKDDTLQAINISDTATDEEVQQAAMQLSRTYMGIESADGAEYNNQQPMKPREYHALMMRLPKAGLAALSNPDLDEWDAIPEYDIPARANHAADKLGGFWRFKDYVANEVTGQIKQTLQWQAPVEKPDPNVRAMESLDGERKRAIAAYESQLNAKNIWRLYSKVRPALAPEADGIIQRQFRKEPWTVADMEAFEALQLEQQQLVAQLAHGAQHRRAEQMWTDAGRAFLEMAVDIPVKATKKLVADNFRHLKMSEQKYQDQAQDRALLAEATAPLMADYNYAQQTVIGIGSTVPYMAYAAIPYGIGFGMIAADQAERQEQQIASAGGQVTGAKFYAMNAASSLAYAAVEMIQANRLLKPLTDVQKRQAFRQFFNVFNAASKEGRTAWRLAAPIAAKEMLASGAFEHSQEIMQAGIEGAFKAWGLGEDVARGSSAAMVQEWKDSAGVMYAMGALGGARQGVHAAMNRDIDIVDLQEGRILATTLLDAHKSGDKKTVARMRAGLYQITRAYRNAGTHENGVKLFRDRGFDPVTAEAMANFFDWEYDSIMKDPDLTRAAKESLLGKDSTARDVLQQLMPDATIAENADGSFAVRRDVNGVRTTTTVKLTDRIDFDPNTPEAAASIAETLRQRGMDITPEQWLALPAEEKQSIIDANRLYRAGDFTLKAKTEAGPTPAGAEVSASQIQELVGEATIARSAHPSTAIHEAFHAFTRYLREIRVLDANDTAKLKEEFGPPRQGVDEVFDEDKAAEEIRNLASGDIDFVKSTVLEKIWDAAWDVLGRMTTFGRRAQQAQTTREAILDQMRSGNYTGIPVGTISEAQRQKNASAKAESAKKAKEAAARKAQQAKEAPEGQSRPETTPPGTPPANANVGPTDEEAAARAEIEAMKRRGATPPAGPVLGKGEWRAVTPTEGIYVSGEWEVRDLDDLVTSDRPGYDQTIQPRNRTTVSSRVQIHKIARTLDANRLMDSAQTDIGAPVVLPNGSVLSGNGRILGMREAVDLANGKFDAYAQAVRAKAAELGIAIPDTIRRPVLVRRLDTIEGKADLQRVAELSNQDDKLQRSAAEQAEADAKLIALKDLIRLYNPGKLGNVLADSNADFISAFVRMTGDDSLLDSNGKPTEEAAKRIRRAMLALVVGQGENAREIIRTLIENAAEVGMTREVDGVMKAAGEMAAIAASKPQYSLLDDLALALRDYLQMRMDGTSPNQGDLFYQRPKAVQLLVDAMNARRTASGIDAMLREYAAMVRTIDTTTKDLFGGADTAKETVLEKAIADTRGNVDAEELAAIRGQPTAPAPTPVTVPTGDNVWDHLGQGSKAVNTKNPPKTQWKRIMPNFQGGKGSMADRTTQAMRTSLSEDERAKVIKVVDHFGGGGSWGLFLSLENLPNARELEVRELNPDRLAKIKLFHERGNEVEGIIASPEFQHILNEAAFHMKRKDGTGLVASGTAVGQRIKDLVTDEMPADFRTIAQAIMDYGENTPGAAESPGDAIEKAIRTVVRDAVNSWKGAEAFRQRHPGATITHVVGSSYDLGPEAGDHILSVMDPPYYRTRGYNGEIAVGVDIYRMTADLIRNATAAGNAIVYTDSAWWVNDQAEGKSDPDGQAVLKDILDTLDGFDIVDGTVGKGRKEVIGIQHARTPQAGAEGVSTTDATAPRLMVAWHSSPYVFDRFSIHKIGTGQGAQSYGYGLYYAGKKAVAESYPRGEKTITYKGVTHTFRSLENRSLKNILASALHLLLLHNGSLADAIVDAHRQTLGDYEKKSEKDRWKSIEVTLKNMTHADFQIGVQYGGLYEVDLKPAEDEYLMWDNPLSEQSEKVKKALIDGGFMEEFLGGENFDGDWSKIGSKYMGRHAYSFEGGRADPKAASKYFSSIGIRGIKYADQGSRPIAEPKKDANGKWSAHLPGGTKTFKTRKAAEAAIEAAKTYNYVIFDDKDVEIKKRYSIQVARWQHGFGKPRGASVFFGPEGNNYADYGPDLIRAEIADGAKIFEGESSFEFLKQRGLSDAPNAAIRRVTQGMAETPNQVLDMMGVEFVNGEDFASLQEAAREILQAEGYDGAHWKDEDALSPEQYQVWNRKVLKSPDVRFSIQAQRPLAPAFYSQLRRVIDAKVPNKATVQQIRATIDPAKGSGIKADEVFWSGLQEFLDSHKPTDVVTKAEVLAATRDVVVQDVVKGQRSNQSMIDEANAKLRPYGIELRREFNMDEDGLAVRAFRGDQELTDIEDIADLPQEAQDIIITEVNETEIQDTGTADFPAGDVKFSQWQLAGGENYRELLLTLPTLEERTKRPSRTEVAKELYGKDTSDLTQEESAMVQAQVEIRDRAWKRDTQNIPDDFTSTHFSEPNILAHVRFNERTVDGKRVLFIEEIQSDWAQKGRAEGFKQTSTKDLKLRPEYRFAVINREQEMMFGGFTTREEAQEVISNPLKLASQYREGAEVLDLESEEGRKLWDPYNTRTDIPESMRVSEDYFVGLADTGQPPSAPYVTKTDAWTRLAFKRMMRWAAENGFDQIAWTTGEQQADRYDLSKQVDEIRVDIANGNYVVEADKEGRRVINKVARGEAELEALVGKDIAKQAVERLKTEKVASFKGKDLKVGGEGMKGFYDKILPSVANDLGKKFGAKVGEIDIGQGASAPPALTNESFDPIDNQEWEAFAGLDSFENGDAPLAAHAGKYLVYADATGVYILIEGAGADAGEYAQLSKPWTATITAAEQAMDAAPPMANWAFKHTTFEQMEEDGWRGEIGMSMTGPTPWASKQPNPALLDSTIPRDPSNGGRNRNKIFDHFEFGGKENRSIYGVHADGKKVRVAGVGGAVDGTAVAARLVADYNRTLKLWREQATSVPVHALPVTDAMRESVLFQGQPRFSIQAAIPRVEDTPAARRTIAEWQNRIRSGDRTPVYIDNSDPSRIVDGNHRFIAYRNEGIEPPVVYVDRIQFLTESASPRFSFQSLAPQYSGNSKAIAALAVQQLLGQDVNTEAAAKAIRLHQAQDITPDQAIAQARKYAESKVGVAARNALASKDPSAAMSQIAANAELDSIAGARAGLKEGLKMGVAATKAEQTATKRLIQAARGENLQTFVVDTGISWTETMLQTMPEVFAQWDAERKAAETGPVGPKPEKEQPPEAPPPTPEQLAERDNRMRNLIEATRAWADQEQAKREKAAEEARKAEEAKSAGQGAEAKPEAEEEEGEPEAEELAIPKELLQANGVDLRNAAEVAHAMRLWMADWIVRNSNGRLTHETVWQDREAVETYRKTMQEQLTDMAHAMIEPEGYALVHVTAMIADIPSTARPDTVENRSRSIIASIQGNAIRQTRKELIREGIKNIDKKAVQGGQFDAMEEDLRRKMPGEMEKTARYIKRVLRLGTKAWTDKDGVAHKSGLDAEFEKLQAELDERKSLYEEMDKAGIHRSIDVDILYSYNSMKLAMLERWGGLKDKLPSEIKAGLAEIDGWMVSAQERLYGRWLKQSEANANLETAMVEAVRPADPEQARKQMDVFDRIENTLVSTVSQRLEAITRNASTQEIRDAAALAVEEIIYNLAAASDDYTTRIYNYRKQWQDAVLEITGSRHGATKYAQHLLDPIPAEAALELSRQGFNGVGNRSIFGGKPETMTYRQAMKLYGDVCQVFYKSNVELHGRQGHKALLESILSAEDIKLVHRLREIYEERRAELSNASLQIYGLPVFRPDPLYLPTQMDIGSRGGLGISGSVRAWKPFAESMAPRRHSGLDFDESSGIDEMYFQRSEDAARAIAYGVRGLTVRGVLGKKSFQDAVVRYYGKAALSGLLKQVTDEMEGMAKGEKNIIDDWVAPVRQANTFLSLSFNPSPVAKQTLSGPVFAMVRDSSIRKLIANVKDFDWQSANEFMDSDWYRARYGGGILPEISDIMADMGSHTAHSAPVEKAIEATDFIKRLYKAGLTTVQMGDMFSSIGVGTGIYKAKKAEFMARGTMTEEEAASRAKTMAGHIVEITQQSSRPMNMPAFYRYSGPFREPLKLFMAFGSAPMLQLNLEIGAFQDWRHGVPGGRQRYIRNLIINRVVMPALMDGVTMIINSILGKEPPDKDEELWRRIRNHMARNFIVGPFSRLMVLGCVAEAAYDAIFEGKAFMGGGMIPAESSIRTMTYGLSVVHDLVTLDSDDLHDDFMKFMRGLGAPFRYPIDFYENRIAE